MGRLGKSLSVQEISGQHGMDHQSNKSEGLSLQPLPGDAFCHRKHGLISAMKGQRCKQERVKQVRPKFLKEPANKTMGC